MIVAMDANDLRSTFSGKANKNTRMVSVWYPVWKLAMEGSAVSHHMLLIEEGSNDGRTLMATANENVQWCQLVTVLRGGDVVGR